MGSMVLMWLKSNKLLTLALLIVLGLGVALFATRMQVKVLQAQKLVCTEEKAAQDATLDRLRKLGRMQEARLSDAAKKIKRREKAYDVLRKDLAEALVPVKCPDAVKWGAEEMNKLMGAE